MRKNQKPKHLQTPSDWASLKRLILRGSDACYLWRLCFFQTVRRHGLEHPRGIVDRRVTEFVKVWKSPEDWPWVIGRGLCDLSSRRIRWGLGVLNYVFRTGCPGLCVLRFKYLAAPTRRTVVTATGTGPTYHCLQRVTGFIFTSFSYCYTLWSHCMLALSFVFTMWMYELFGFITSSYLILITLQLLVIVLSLCWILDHGLPSVI